MVKQYKSPTNYIWHPENKSGEYVVIYPNGTKFWYKDGLRHRENGPAIIYYNNHKEWYRDGKLHRVGGLLS